MTIEIRMLTLGIAHTNCYIIADIAAGDALVIDPVDDAPFIFNVAQEAGWTIRNILATHGHFDHVLASSALKDLTGAPFYIHQADQPFLDDLPQTGIRWTGKAFAEAAVPDGWLQDGDMIEMGAIRLEVLFTPGHAPGHVSFLARDLRLLFSGDCLFRRSIGRTDLPGADYDTLMRSITQVLFPLGDDVRVLPGHGPETTLGTERETNPFVLDFLKA
jgi:glyoxylase-like metal-dependent hydrolase (beta-lactamase superfamily II)